MGQLNSQESHHEGHMPVSVNYIHTYNTFPLHCRNAAATRLQNLKQNNEIQHVIDLVKREDGVRSG